MSASQNRRDFLVTTGVLGTAVIGTQFGVLRAEEPHKDEEGDESEISAPEDLMREHGLLNRILLIYEEATRRVAHKEDVPADIFQKPAKLVRAFVEDYHERLEEKFIFPKFEEKQKLVDLVAVLKKQHDAGRKLTDEILRMTGPSEYSRRETRERIIGNCHSFIRMYRPHEAREDTVLFPTLYKIASAKDIKELGEQFEEQEHKLFGGDGFQENVGKVAEIEKQLGIYELGSFTPKV
jgi:hemerythrin-like domain-containing protein